MLLLTDGIVNCFDNPAGDDCGLSETHNEEGAIWSMEVAQIIADNNVIVYGIAFGPDANQAILEDISTLTGGQFFFAPTAADLLDIYNQIASEISIQSFTIPDIESSSPLILESWEYPTEYSVVSTWNDGSCGNSNAICSDFRSVLQQNLDNCASDPCDVYFSVDSTSAGQLDLTNLLIETELVSDCGNSIIEPPAEVCDDGNEVSGDGCDENCQLEAPPGCGNSFPDIGEECDDGANGNDLDLCTDSCFLTFCGDGLAQLQNGQGTGGPLDNGQEQCRMHHSLYNNNPTRLRKSYFRTIRRV